jgi:hypothetical protein
MARLHAGVAPRRYAATPDATPAIMHHFRLRTAEW